MTPGGRRRPASRLDNVTTSGIREIYEALNAWSAAVPGRRPIPFHFGMPDFDTPEPIKQALYDAVAAGFVKYTSSRGINDLLIAVARKLQRDNGIAADPDRHADCDAECAAEFLDLERRLQRQ